MKKKAKYGLMIYPGSPKYNVGDYIQSLAAKQYLPEVNQLIEREKLSSYNEENVKMIMNGWYIHNVNEFKPSDKIEPFYISFHLNSYCSAKILSNKSNVDYLKSKSPIGCRDYYTLEQLKNAGIDAYYSGCLTTTLDINYSSNEKREKIYFADPLWTLPHFDKLMYSKRHLVKGILNGDIFKFNERDNILKNIFTEEIISKSEKIQHKLPANHTEEERFKNAEETLRKFSTAKLVVTSRIHAALPCLALKTPVLFINYGLDDKTELSRLNGLMELFNTINISKSGKITTNFNLPENKKIGINDIIDNPTKYLEIAKNLKEKCYNFINEDK